MKDKFETLAHALADAWHRCGTIALPAADAAPASRADAFAVQDRMAEIIGERCAGWKVGAAVRAVQVLEGHDGPITGRLLAPRMFTSPMEVSGVMFDGYKIECEFAFRFAGEVPVRERPWTRDELAPGLAFVPGLEIAGTRYASGEGGRKFTTHDAIADNGSGGAYVAGGDVALWRNVDFENMRIEARIDGGELIHTYTGEFRRDPLDILVETVNGLAKRGIGLGAGDILSTGSLTQPTPLRKGQTYVADFGGLQTLSVSMG